MKNSIWTELLWASLGRGTGQTMSEARPNE
jgi:hypothetical protein